MKNTSEQENTVRQGKSVAQVLHQKKLCNTTKSHVGYWRDAIRKRIIRGSESANWYAVIAWSGRREWINLNSANKTAAAETARQIYASVVTSGWDETLLKYGKAKPQSTTTLDEFITLYRTMVKTVEFPPSRPTYERYIHSLEFICRYAGVNKLQDLSAEKIQAFKVKYLAGAQETGADENSMRVTVNFHIRNAAALFSRQMVQTYQTAGLTLANPFTGQKIRRVEIKGYSPMDKSKLDAIWADAAKLRDGDPEAEKRVIIRTGGRKAKLPPGEKSKRWQAPDLSIPHPDAYALLILELGLGLRRNEADKAEWDWFFEKDGRQFIEVKETPYFVPKSKERRVIPVEPVLYAAIQAARTHAGPWIVPGRLPKRYEPGNEPKAIAYRCDPAHRALAHWLRSKGIADDKPCHLLRKEFGSYVATSFGLFYAQKLLGHSSPEVTSSYYAGLTGLPELKHAQIQGKGQA